MEESPFFEPSWEKDLSSNLREVRKIEAARRGVIMIRGLNGGREVICRSNFFGSLGTSKNRGLEKSVGFHCNELAF